jgi:hypothetical protein
MKMNIETEIETEIICCWGLFSDTQHDQTVNEWLSEWFYNDYGCDIILTEENKKDNQQISFPYSNRIGMASNLQSVTLRSSDKTILLVITFKPLNNTYKLINGYMIKNDIIYTIIDYNIQKQINIESKKEENILNFIYKKN